MCDIGNQSQPVLELAYIVINMTDDLRRDWPIYCTWERDLRYLYSVVTGPAVFPLVPAYVDMLTNAILVIGCCLDDNRWLP